MSTQDTGQIEDDIKTVVWNSSNQIKATDQGTAFAANVPRAFSLLLAAPMVGLILQGARYFFWVSSWIDFTGLGMALPDCGGAHCLVVVQDSNVADPRRQETRSIGC